MIFSEVEAFASLMERLSKRLLKKEECCSEELVSTRFIKICEAHGVHRNQIPRLFGNGLSVNDVKSDSHLLEKLSEDIIERACLLFGVKRDWLDGVTDQVYSTYDFYKDPNGFKMFLAKLLEKNEGDICGVLLSPKEKDKNNNAILLLQETVGYLGDYPYYRYYICSNWDFSYWKSRAYLTACISCCWLNKIYVHGLTTSNEYINSISDGLNILDLNKHGIFNITGSRWYAENMASIPEAFLNKVDAERDNYGVISGLKLWLELESYGYMNCGYNDTQARQRFVDELKKQTQ